MTIVVLGTVLLLTNPLVIYMAKVFEGERTWLSPVFVHLCDAGLLGGQFGLALPVASHAAMAAVQSAAFPKHGAGSRVEHGDQLPYEYQLAVLFRRERTGLRRGYI